MKKKYLSLWLPIVVWMLVIFSFSSLPTNPTSKIYWQDFVVKKTAHVVEYAVLTVLFYRALSNSGVSKKRSAIYSIIVAVVYGASDEFHQSFTPGREPRIRDVVFDTIGSLLAVYALWKLLPKAPLRLKSLAKALQVN